MTTNQSVVSTYISVDMDYGKINRLKESIKKLKDKLNKERDYKKRQVITLRISVQELQIKIASLK